MFGRPRTTQTSATATPTKPGGKGRPTPSRRDAQARNRRPVVGAPQLRADATKEERRAAKVARSKARKAEQSLMREAMVTGDDRHLPARDQGPAKRFARDYVDARRNLGEYMLLGAVLILFSSFARIPIMSLVSVFALYLMVLAIGIDTYLLRRRVGRLVTARFGADKARGVGGYAMMRALQMRRSRRPVPQVKRGQFPE